MTRTEVRLWLALWAAAAAGVLIGFLLANVATP